MEYGYWPNVGYVTFLETSLTESGTVEWKNVLKVYGSMEEAKEACIDPVAGNPR